MPLFNLRNVDGTIAGMFYAPSQLAADQAAADASARVTPDAYNKPPFTAEFYADDPEEVEPLAQLPPYLAAPIPDNAGAPIGAQAWTTVTLADALSPGPLTMTDGTDFIQAGDIVEITQRLESGWRPLRPNGTPAYVQNFLGGYLIDGNPLNVILGEPWLPEQWAAIVPAIQSGVVPSPSIQPTPDEIAVLTTGPGVMSAGAADDGFMKFALPATGLAAIGILWAWSKRRKGN